jgi:hypothetical protein
MTEYSTYEQGLMDAKCDLADGWICMEEIALSTPEKLAQELIVNVGATMDYIRGYLDGITPQV